MNELVSIVMPNYNYAPYLARAIQSVLTQDYTHLELILIEDGSSDNSLEIATAFCTQDVRVRLINNVTNKGVYYSINAGLEAARGKYIHFLASDDFYLPHFLSTCLSALIQHPHSGLSVCNTCYYTHNPEVRYPYVVGMGNKSCLFTPQELGFAMRDTKLKFSGTNCIVKTSLVKEFGGFKRTFYSSCDWILLTKIALSIGAVYIPQVLVCWQKNPHGVSSSALSNKKICKEMYGNILDDLQSSSPELFHLFKISGELGCVLKYAPMELLKRKKFWPFLLPAIGRYLRRQVLLVIRRIY